MDSELSGTSLKESFHKISDTNTSSNSLDNVSDIKGNLLKYLLESHVSQTSAAGPASNFLAMLGTKMPEIPKNSS